jgi:D-alanyl-D-alanine carboxypeptidase/D-alanyl-D-alanine-endopeptidase (penicillin-binding protein 4)
VAFAPPTARARRRVAAATALALLAGASTAVGARSAATPPALASALASWTASNPATSAVVWRLDPTGPVEILTYKATVPRRPASTMKLVTATSALLGLSPTFRFETRLYAAATATRSGATLTGPIYLKGSGDPTLATAAYANRYLHGYGANVGMLARQIRALGIRRVTGPLVVDESMLDSLRLGPTWPARYVVECQPLSGLTVNQSFLGEQRGRYVKHPPIAAGGQLRIAMRRVGVVHAGRVVTGRTPARGRLLATVQSPPLRVILGLMLPDSDNFLAEMLAKDVGAYTRGTGSTAAGTAQALKVLTAKGLLGTGDRLADGSGLALEDRLTATSLVRVLAAANAEPSWGGALLSALAHGGEGTLKRRFLAPALRRRVHAKTGYINRTSTLAGVIDSTGGSRYAFAIMMNQGSITEAKATQDRIVTLLARGVADGS